MDFSKLNSINKIEELLLQCLNKRHENICTKITLIGEVFIKAVIITNDFQKPVIDPFFLYISMLPIDIIPIDSILSFEIVNNKLVVKLYSNNNDNETGIRLNLDLLNRMNIEYYKLNRLPEKIYFIDSDVKEKINFLRLIKDDWEFLQIYDCIFKTQYIFKKMTELINSKDTTKEQILGSIYYKYLVKGDYTVPYLPIIASNENASYIHYFNNNSSISKGSVILMDCGVKNKYGYASDITRTIIDEKCLLQKKIYNIVKKAQDSCVQMIKEYLNNNQKISLTYLDDRCIFIYINEFAKLEPDEKYLEWSNGIVNCKINSFVKAKKFVKKFYTHFIGHNIGLEAHDPNGYNFLEERCIFTIEPGIYFNKNTIDFKIPPEYYDIGGIRIEDMYTILNNSGKLELVNLSDNIPKIQ
jgi:Xaa-Pro aminopeptidase